MANYNLTQTGAEVQAILNRVAAGYIYMGTADLTTTPDTTNPKVCYLLTAVGTYTNFGNIQHSVGIGLAIWNGTSWGYEKVQDITTKENSLKLIKLVGFAASGATSGVTSIGDTYYNTTTKLLRRCTSWSGNPSTSQYETITYFDGAIYTYDGSLYIYNGTELVHIEEELYGNVTDLERIIRGNYVSNVSSLPIYSSSQVINIITSTAGNSPTLSSITSGKTVMLKVDGNSYVEYPTFLSSGGLGSCFIDSNGFYISGYSESSESTGTYKILSVPETAEYLLIGLNSTLSSGEYYAKTTGIENEIRDISNNFYSIDLIDFLQPGYFDLSVQIGSIIDISNRTTSTNTRSLVAECKEGETFELSGYGGSSSRMWGFLDSEYHLISRAEANIVTKKHFNIIAPENAAYLIYQTAYYAEYGYCEKICRIDLIEKNILSLQGKVSEENNDIGINSDTYYNDGFLLLALKSNIPTNNLPFNLGFLFCKWNDNSQLYYGRNLTDIVKIPSPATIDNKAYKFAISPKDGRIIMAKRNERGNIYIWDGTIETSLPFESATQKPMGWLYNSGCCFVNDGADEICLFAEYSQSPATSGGFNVWRGIYPYTSENNWSVVLHMPYVGDDASGITHFHQVRRDPWTGIVYLTSGDGSEQSMWWYSTDNGNTFTLLTTGATSGFEDHICRCINFLFTEDKVYFATDHGTNHCLNNIERDSNTGVIDVTTRQKLSDLPYGQATNFLCYSQFPKGIFMYDRWDIGYTPLDTIRVQFYSLESSQLLDVVNLDISGTWGGHRGGCYVEYLSTTMEKPAMGFDSNSPCIFKLNNPYISKIGTIFYSILGKEVYTI